MTITVTRVVLARGDHHESVERELWHHDFRCDADATLFADRLRKVAPVRDGREHVDVQTIVGDESDIAIVADYVLDRFLGGVR
jgi:hypothetical protein